MVQDALTRQIDGNHYTKMGMQPFEFTMFNGWDSCAHTILKYVSRAKHGAVDFEKAAHTCEIRANLFQRLPPWRFRPLPVVFPVASFCRVNNLDIQQTVILEDLEDWVKLGSNTDHAIRSSILSDKINRYRLTRFQS